MRKLTAVFLMLCVSLMCVGALAAPGDITLLRMGEDSYTGRLVGMAELDGTAYMLSGSELYTYKSGDEKPAAHPWDAKSFTTEDDADLSRLNIVSDGDTVYLLCSESEFDYEDRQVEITGAKLCELIINDDGSASVGEGYELDWDDMALDMGDYQYSADVHTPFIMDGMLIFCTNTDSGRTIIMAYDIEDGDGDELYLGIDNSKYGVNGICAYKDEQILCLLKSSSGDSSIICSFDLDDEELTELCTIPATPQSYPSGIAYSAESDTAYYMLNGELFSIAGMDVNAIESIADMPLSVDASIAVLTSDGFYIAGDYDLVLRRNTDPSMRANVKLTVQNEYNDSITNAFHAFTKANGDIQVVIVEQVDDIVQAMINRSPAVDVYLLAASSSAYNAVYTRGYMAELTESEKIVNTVERIYPAISELCVKNGETVAAPVETYIQCISYSPETFAMLGLSEDDVPKTWVEFFETLSKMYELIEDDPRVLLFEPYSRVSAVKKGLFNRMLDDYMTYISQPGSVFALDTPAFRAMIEAYEAVDFNKLGLLEDDVDMLDFIIENDAVQVYATQAGFSPRTNSLELGLKPLMLKLANDTEPFMKASVSLVFVNPFSEHREEATMFVETIIDEMLSMTKVQLMPDENAPVENPYFEASLQHYDETIDMIKTMLDKAPDDERAFYEAQLEEAKFQKQDFVDKNKYTASVESIANYRNYADKMLVQRYIGINEESAQEYDMSLTQYMDGMITADEFIRGIDKKLQMIKLEGN